MCTKFHVDWTSTSLQEALKSLNRSPGKQCLIEHIEPCQANMYS